MRKNQGKLETDKQMSSHQVHYKNTLISTYSGMKKAVGLMCTALIGCSGPMNVGSLPGQGAHHQDNEKTRAAGSSMQVHATRAAHHHLWCPATEDSPHNDPGNAILDKRQDELHSPAEDVKSSLCKCRDTIAGHSTNCCHISQLSDRQVTWFLKYATVTH